MARQNKPPIPSRQRPADVRLAQQTTGSTDPTAGSLQFNTQSTLTRPEDIADLHASTVGTASAKVVEAEPSSFFAAVEKHWTKLAALVGLVFAAGILYKDVDRLGQDVLGTKQDIKALQGDVTQHNTDIAKLKAEMDANTRTTSWLERKIESIHDRVDQAPPKKN